MASLNKTKSSITFGGLNPYGICSTDDGTIPGYNLDDAFSTDKTINAGNWPTEGTKFVQTDVGATTYKLEYTSGKNINQFVKDQNGVDIIFNTDIPYIETRLETNEPSMDLRYYGFILYWVNPIIDSIPTEPQTYSVTLSESPVYTVGSYGTPSYKTIGTIGKIVLTNVTPSGGTTPAVTYDILKAINNIVYNPEDINSVAFWSNLLNSYSSISGQTSMAKLKEYINSCLSGVTHQLNIPRQKIINTKCYREVSPNNWVEQKGIYTIVHFSVDFTISASYNTSNEYDTTPVLQFKVDVGKFDPASKSMKYGVFYTTTKVGQTTYGPVYELFEYDPSFLNNPFNYLDNNQNLFTNNVQTTDGFYFTASNYLTEIHYVSTDENGGTIYNNIYYDEYGNTFLDNFGNYFNRTVTYGQDYRFYQVTLGCSDGSDIGGNGLCNVTKTYTVSYNDTVLGETATTVTLAANEFTYTKGSYFIGDGKYPVIKSNDYKSVRNVINNYLQSILVLAQTGKNNGMGDADTITELGAWNAAQAQQTNIFNKDDPDTSFLGYHAESTGLIKLDFYNVLVDAYKIMINSCICNANCACNLVCSCNVNCGCNY